MKGTVRASLELDGGVTVGCDTGRVDSVKFVHVKNSAHFLAQEAFVSEVPTVEVAVVVEFGWVDILHGGYGEGRNWVRGASGGPRIGG